MKLKYLRVAIDTSNASDNSANYMKYVVENSSGFLTMKESVQLTRLRSPKGFAKELLYTEIRILKICSGKYYKIPSFQRNQLN